MKLIIKYDGGQDAEKDYHLKTSIEYIYNAELIGSGYNHETGMRDMEFDVVWPPGEIKDVGNCGGN